MFLPIIDKRLSLLSVGLRPKTDNESSGRSAGLQLSGFEAKGQPEPSSWDHGPRKGPETVGRDSQQRNYNHDKTLKNLYPIALLPPIVRP